MPTVWDVICMTVHYACYTITKKIKALFKK